MMLKKGIQIATSVIANGQYGAGSAGMLVMPKMLVTKVNGNLTVSQGWRSKLEVTHHEEEVDNRQNLDVVSLVYRNIGQLDGLPRLLDACSREELLLQSLDLMSPFVVLALQYA